MTNHAIDCGCKWTAYRVIQKGIPPVSVGDKRHPARTAVTSCHSEKRIEADEGRQSWYSIPADSQLDTTAFLWSGFTTGLHLAHNAACVFVLGV